MTLTTSAPPSRPGLPAAPLLAPPQRLMQGLVASAAAGGAVFLLGMLLAPERAWGGYLLAFCFLTTLALAGPLFLSILHLAGPRWGLGLRRVPEAMGAALPAAFALGLVLITGTHALYEWAHPQAVLEDELLQHKAAWLSVTGFSVRMVIYFAVWIFLARKLADLPSGTGSRRRSTIVSALFMAALSVTLSLAGVDWIMSLEPHWFSAIFGLRLLSGIGTAGVAVCILALVVLRRRGPWRAAVTRDMLDDLGKILLGLSLFWAYIWYCQYMVIWYTNIPEETGYYVLRAQGDWPTLTRLSLVLSFAVPFLALMLRAFRRSPVALARIAACVLAGHALDLFLMIAPPLQGAEARVGAWELGPLAGALALFTWILLRALSRPPLRRQP